MEGGVRMGGGRAHERGVRMSGSDGELMNTRVLGVMQVLPYVADLLLVASYPSYMDFDEARSTPHPPTIPPSLARPSNKEQVCACACVRVGEILCRGRTQAKLQKAAAARESGTAPPAWWLQTGQKQKSRI